MEVLSAISYTAIYAGVVDTEIDMKMQNNKRLGELGRCEVLLQLNYHLEDICLTAFISIPANLFILILQNKSITHTSF